LVKTLGQLIEFFEEDREVCVSRELTKVYEENRRGKCSEVLKHYEEYPPKGEIVLIIEGRS